MTTELEKQFFDTFGIEPKTNREYGHKMAIYNEAGTEEIKFYPQITDRILLELICILSSNPIRILFESMLGGIKEVELLKNSILLVCIANRDAIKQQVQALFKE